MKYQVIVVNADEQQVVADVDDMWIACMIADTYEKSRVFDETYIVKE